MPRTRKVTKNALPDAAPTVEGTDPKLSVMAVNDGMVLGNKIMPLLKGTSGEIVAQAFLYVMFALGYNLGMQSAVVIGIPVDEAAALADEMLGPKAEKKEVVN